MQNIKSSGFVQRCSGDVDGRAGITFSMTRKPRKARPGLYEEYKAASGWYLAAWRDFRGLTLEDLADELGMSKGYVSDLETGAQRGGRPANRFNRDTMLAVAQAVGTTGGRLIDVNPYDMDERAGEITDLFATLPEEQRAALHQLAITLKGNRAA